MNTELIQRTSIVQLVAAWSQSQQQVRSAFASIVEAGNRLNQVFTQGNGSGREIRIDSGHGSHVDFKDPDSTLLRLKQDVWRVIVDRLELRKIMSLARIKELESQLEHPEELPDITEANVTAMLETNLNLMGQHLEEKVRECYELMRPGGWTREKYKTNAKSAAAGVGRKLVLTWKIESHYSGGWRVAYYALDQLRAMDQVFHMLDGKPMPAGHYGEIYEAIHAIPRGENTFTTASGYFKGRCFSNNNLHLEFLRLDLLEQFNLVAGGARLQDVRERKAA